MRKALCIVLLTVAAVVAKDRKSIQPAPLPSQIVNAKRVFVAKGVGATAHTVKGGYDLAFDSFYSEMKKWGRYEIVGSPDEADVIFEIGYRVEQGGTRVWSSTNPSNGTTQVHSAQAIDAQLTLVAYDSRTKTELWSTSVPPGTAFRHKNQEKEMIIAGERLAKSLEQRLELSGSNLPTNSPTATPRP